jgi:uncharacterized protein with GYD domain
MPRYMAQFAYTADAWAALSKNPADRREGLRTLLQGMGGQLIELYYHFGEYDGTLIMEAPDDTTATAVILAAVAPGHVRATKTTRLMTVEETMEAMRKAGGQSYQAPSASR